MQRVNDIPFYQMMRKCKLKINGFLHQIFDHENQSNANILL